jgi:protein TonB
MTDINQTPNPSHPLALLFERVRAALRPGHRWFPLALFMLALTAGLLIGLLWLGMRRIQPAAATTSAAAPLDPQHPALPAPISGGLSTLPTQIPTGPNAAYIKPTLAAPQPDASEAAFNPIATTQNPEVSAAGAQASGDSEPQVIEHTQPDYPVDALRAHEEGETRLQIALDALGNVEDVRLAHSSGSRTLDRAAMDAARNWRFRPAMRAGQAVSGLIEVPVEFHLDDQH